MRKKLLNLMLAAAMLLPLVSQAQVVVEIGNPEATTTQYSLPVNMYYNYSLTQQIFTADEIGVGGTITSVAFEYTNTSAFTMDSVRLYMKSVTKESFATTTDMEAIASTDLVWEGTLSASEAGWVTITLNTPFVYDGASNLLVCFYDHMSGYPGSAYKFRTTATTDYLGMAYYSDSYVPSVDDVTTFSGSKTRYQYRNNIRIGITPSGNFCAAPASLEATSVGENYAFVVWGITSASTYQFEYKTSTDDTWTVVTVADTTYSMTNLQANTVYNIRVKSICGADSESGYRNASFRTNCSATQPLPYAEDFSGYTGLAAYPYNGPSVIPSCWYFYSNGTNTAETASSAYYGGVASYTSASSYGSMEANNPYLYLPVQLTGENVTNTTYLGYEEARGNVKIAILPAFALPLSNLQISFDYKMSTAYSTTGAAATLSLGYVMGDDIEFVTMQTYNAVTTTQSVVELNLSTLAAMAPAGARLAFKFTGVHNGTSTTSYTNVACGIDNILVEQLPTCQRVENLSVAGIDGNAVVLNWTDNSNGDSTTYTVYIMGETGPVAVDSNITSTMYYVGDLTPNTVYTFGVAANCSANDVSSISTVSARTLCVAFTAPYFEDFDDMTANTTPDCWLKYEFGSALAQVTTGTTYSGSNKLRFSGVAGGNLIYLPLFTQPTNTLQVRFMTRPESISNANCGTFSVGYMIDTAFVPVATYAYNDWEAAAYEERTVPMVNAPADARIAMRHDAVASNWYWYVDDVTVEELPSCFPVDNLIVSGTTSSSVSLQWVDSYNNGWNISYTIYNVTDSTVVGTINGGESYTVTGLAEDTPYTFAVMTNCSADDASTLVYVNARTACGALTYDELPYTEDFEDYGTGATAAISTCWTKGTNSTTAYPYPNSTAASGTRSLYFYGYKPSPTSTASPVYSYAALPALDNSVYITDLTLSFKARRYSSTAATNRSIIYVGVMTDPTDVNTFQTLQVFDMTHMPASTIEQYSVNLNSYSGNGRYVAFYCPSIDTTTYSYNYIYIDDVVLDVTPACAAPMGLTASNITADAATLTWVGTGNSFNVYAVEPTGAATLVTNVTDHGAFITGLTGMTEYTYGVTAVCGSVESDMATVTFTTACSAVAIPFTEGFEDNSNTRSCWTTEGPGTWSIATGDYSSTTGAYEGTLNAKIVHSTSGNVTKLISPAIDGATNGMQLSFAHIQRAWAGDQDELRVYYRTSANDTVWQMLAEYTTAYSNWALETININGPVHQVAFEMTDGYGYGVAIDNVVFNQPASCLPLTDMDVEITGTTVTLSWTGDAASYGIYNAGDYVTSTTATTYTFTGLTPNTDYLFGVTVECSPNDESDMYTVGLRTGCGDGYCRLAIAGSDSFGDGWNGNAINVYQNGDLISNFTLATGEYNFEYWCVTNNDAMSFEWVVGSYPGEASFEIYSDDALLYSGVGSDMDSGLFYSVTNPCSASQPGDDSLTVVITTANVEGIVTTPMGTTNPVPGIHRYAYNGDTLVFIPEPLSDDYAFYFWRVTYVYGGDTVIRDLEQYMISIIPQVWSAVDTIYLQAFFHMADSLQIIVAVNDATMGSTDPVPGTYFYNEYEIVYLTALPNDGYSFVNWVLTAGVDTLGVVEDDVLGFYAYPSWMSVDPITITANFEALGCDPIVITSTSPYVEDFESGSLNNCWSMENVNGTASWTVGTGDYSTSTGAHQGSYNAKIVHNTTGNVTRLVTPLFDATALTNAQLNFWYVNRSWSGDIDALRIYYRVSADGAWMSIDSLLDAHASWTEATYGLPSNAVQVAFEMTDSYGYGVAIDDITIGEAPTCLAVTDLTVVGVTANSITLSWSDALNSGATYSVYDGNGNVEATGLTATTYTVTGLTAETNYIFGVIANCSANDASAVVTINAYTGYCSPNPTSVDGSGITNVSFGGMINTTHPTSAGYANYSSMVGSVPAGTTATVDITYATGYTYGTIIWVDWDNSLTFEGDEVVYVGTSENVNPTVLSATFDVPATQALGNYRMRIMGADMAFDSYISSIAAAAAVDPCATYSWGVAEDYTLAVTTAPACMYVTDLTVSDVTGSTATITWNDTLNSGATYTVYSAVDVAGTAPVMVATGLTATTYTFTGLASNTDYIFGVTADCSATESSSMVTVAARTNCADGNCHITIAGTDSYGDGWNGNAINVYQNGTFVSTFTLASGSFASEYWCVSNTDAMSFEWVAGSWASEVSFTISNDDEVIYSGSGSEMVDSTIFFSVTDPCSFTMAHDTLVVTIAVNDSTMGTTIPAPGTYNYLDTDTLWLNATANTGYHFVNWTATFVSDGEVETVVLSGGATQGYLVSSMIALSPITFTAYFEADPSAIDCSGTSCNLMVYGIDAYGDGWNGASLELYQRDTLVGLFTVSDSAATATFQVCDDYPVDLVWNEGSWDSEISFAIYSSTGTLIYLDTIVNLLYDGSVFATITTACSNPTIQEHVDSATIVFAINDASLGSITPLPGTYQYVLGDTVHVSAVPTDSSAFMYWEVSYVVDGVTVVDDSIYYDAFVLTVNNYEVNHSPITLTAVFGEVGSVDCSGTSCYLTIDGTDSYGDGWNGASLELYQNNTLIGYVTMDSGSVVSSSIEVCNDYPVNFVWNSGMYDSEISLSVNTAVGDNLFTLNGVSGLSDGEVFATVTTACSNPTVQIFEDTVEITIAVNDSTMGTTNPAPGTYQFGSATDVMIEAIPNPGYYIMGWSISTTDEDGITEIDTIDVAVPLLDLPVYYYIDDENVIVTALFTDDSSFAPVYDTMYVNISVNDATMGTTNPAPGLHYFITGENASVVAMPYDGYHIAGWSVQVTDTYSGATLMDTTLMWAVEDCFDLFGGWEVEEGDGELYWNITAIFEGSGPVVTDDVTLITAVNDPTMGTMTPAPGTYTYSVEDSVSFTFTPYDGYFLHSVHLTVSHPIYGVIADETVLTDTIDISELEGQYIYFEDMEGMTISITAIFAPNEGIDDVDADNVNIYSAEGRIFVEGAEGRQVVLFDVNGRVLSREARATERVEMRVNASGVYLVKVGEAAARRVVVIR